MAQVEKRGRIWFYCRDLDFTASLSTSTSSQSSVTGGPKALKHWAVILDDLDDDDPSEVSKRILYEANNVGGLLVARDEAHGNNEEKKDWKQKSGFIKEDHGMVTFNEAKAKWNAHQGPCNQIQDWRTGVDVQGGHPADQFEWIWKDLHIVRKSD